MLGRVGEGGIRVEVGVPGVGVTVAGSGVWWGKGHF